MKKNGTLINSIKGIKVKIDIVNGTGRGEGKEYINLIFSDKPSETVRNSMKDHYFKFYKVNGTWSTYKTDKAMEFAYSLIKENNIKTEPQETVEPTKPQKTARGSSNSKKSEKTRLDILEERVNNIDKKFDKLMDKIDAIIK